MLGEQILKILVTIKNKVKIENKKLFYTSNLKKYVCNFSL